MFQPKSFISKIAGAHSSFSTVSRNYYLQEMLTAAEEFVKDERHNNCHSCIVVVLTHGDRGTLTGTDCKPLKIEKFVGAFHGDKAPLLAGMPKLFFFQACRGGKFPAFKMS